MKSLPVRSFLPFAAVLGLGLLPAAADNWYSWRGPTQDGRSAEKYGKYTFSGKPLWTYDIASRGEPVVANGRIYLFGYHGEGSELVETMTCLDEKTGKLLWEKTFADFLSDNAYTRYAIGAPTIDQDTGLIYLLTTPHPLVVRIAPSRGPAAESIFPLASS